jgi:hypothetical protein
VQEIGLKTKAPSLLSDGDISVHQPHTSPFGTGVIYTIDGSTEFHIFRQRLDLASIAGKVYDLLYSSHAMKATVAERQTRAGTLQNMLESWYACILPPFTLDNASGNVQPADLVHLSHMYHVYLGCMGTANGVWSCKAEWTRRMSTLGRAAMKDFACAVFGAKVFHCMETQNPPLQNPWNHCVDTSRKVVKLFHQSPMINSLKW